MDKSVIPNKNQLLDAYHAMIGTMDIKKNELLKLIQPYFHDYNQLIEKGRPINNDFQQLKSNINNALPKQEDFSNPQQMIALALGINDPTRILPKTAFSKAHKLAQTNASKPIEKGGLGLPKNNTALDRAKAMGFSDMPMYHGTSRDIDKFDLNYGGATSGSKVGQLGVSLGDNPQIADEFAYFANKNRGLTGNYQGENVLPLLHRFDYPASMDLPDEVMNHEVQGAVLNAWDMGKDALRMNNYTTPGGNKIGPAYIIKNPAQIRSRFAAFDPKKKNSENILASILAGTALSSQYIDKK
jgi:hypothetical protein